MPKKGWLLGTTLFLCQTIDDDSTKRQSIRTQLLISERNPLGKRYADYASVLVLVFCILWFCQDLILYGEVPFYRDLTNYFYPLRYSLYESYRAGQLPLWDRHFAQGFPNLAAFQTGVFYPPHFTFYIS